MPVVRSELVKGVAVLSVFLVLMITTNILFPYPLEQSGYTVIGIKRLNENPLPFEGSPISTSATVVSVTNNGTHVIAEVVEGANLVFPISLGHPETGQRILLRGTSWLASNGSIEVDEFQVLDSSSSVIRSIPGILLFILLFFLVFTVDINQIAFKPKDGGAQNT